MIQWMHKWMLLWAVLCLASISSAQSPVNRHIAIADSLLTVGDTTLAQACLHYGLLTDTLPEAQTTLRTALAYLYKKQQNYAKAAEYFGEYEFSDSTSADVGYNFILTCYLAGWHSEVMLRYKQYTRIVGDSVAIFRVGHIHLLTLTELQLYDSAVAYLPDWLHYVGHSAKTDSLAQLLIQSYELQKRSKPLKQKNAIRWATYLPGSGHLYAHAPLEAATSFTLQAASAYFTYSLWGAGLYFTALTYGGSFLMQFYKGNIRRAGFLAQQRNMSEIAEYQVPIKQLIVQIVEQSVH